MGSGFSKMKKQAKLMEQQLEAMQNELKLKRFTGTSGNGLVTVVLNGEKKVLEVHIKPECVDPNDLEGLEDLIKAAHEAAFLQANEDPSNHLSLPSGGSFPFM